MDESGGALLSYGHHVEFAWLMLRAEEVLGRPPSLAHFDAIVQHALDYGFDHQRGGLHRLGFGKQAAHDTDKVWWPQAELLAALTVGLRQRRHGEQAAALEKLLRFIRTYQADPADGIWLDTVTAEGKPKCRAKAHPWKAGYHEVRALVKFARAFGAPCTAAGEYTMGESWEERSPSAHGQPRCNSS